MHKVFISYRREGGYGMAMLLYYRLREDGYEPFIDVESLRGGVYDTQLHDRIAECTDFVCVLSPGALDQRIEGNDWVRIEAAEALRLKKNVVPFIMQDFSYPDHLPPDIAALRRYNDVRQDNRYFDAAYQRLLSMLVSKSPQTPGLSLSELSDLHAAYKALLETAYERLADFRDATRGDDVEQLEELSGPLQESMVAIYRFAEKYQQVDPDDARDALAIIDQYNAFINHYGTYLRYPVGDARRSAEAERYAILAERDYANVISLVVQGLSG